MDILISVVAKIAELTVEPIGRQVGYLLCYRNNFKQLKDQVEELQATKERIDHEVEYEIGNGREIEGDVLRWQESVIETLDEAKKVCGDARNANVGCSRWSFPNFKSQHQLSRKAKKMAITIAEMKEKGNFDKGVGYVPHLDITKNFPAIGGSGELESRNLVKKDVVSSLKDPKASKIGVYGISGVGKTTLVKEVAKQVKDEKLFDTVVFITISQTNIERIQDEIAEQLGLRLEEMTSSIIRANRLCERIKREKNILIILDDIWEKIDLEKLGIPSSDIWGKINSDKLGVHLKDDYKGCKLLFTSRSQDILQKNDTQKNFSLQILNDVESWKMFEAMVGDVVHDADFQTIATQVAQKCVGLPVLIVTIAKSLKDKNIYYWNDTLNNLLSVDNKDVHDLLLSSLEFSLNRLEVDMKQVFLLCGVHGTSMIVSDLLKYVFGLGIFNNINTIEGARNRLYRIIGDLKASCLLVDDDSRLELVEMHDIVREVAILIASKEVFTRTNTKWQDWPRNDVLKRCTHIILDRCCIQKLPERLDCPHLTFLHIASSDNRTLKIPGSFFEGMGNLEALDLTGMIISSLPISLSSLTKLKTLCLDQCSLKDMKGIGALINLEILSFIYSSMEEFPSEIGQLTNLRMLDLRNSGVATFLPNILSKLTKIEELYMGNATINWEVETSTMQKRNAGLLELGHLKNLTTLEIQIREGWLLPREIPFDKLIRYKVIIGDKWEWSSNEETSKLLKVKLDTNIRWERGINTLIEGADDLYLDKISGIPNVFFELYGKGFPLLKHLHIQNNGEINYMINSIMKRDQTHVSFPRLETLILHNLNNLVKICDGPLRDNSFGKLTVIKVKSCDQLVYLFSVSMVKAFSQLAEIEVSRCSSMKKIVSVESTDSGKTIDEKIEFLSLCSLTLQHLPTIDNFCLHKLTSSQSTQQNSLRANIPTPFFSNKVKFSNLETLRLSSINLKKIWEDNQSFAPCLVQNLANLTVENCSGLTYLFSSSMVGRLLNLKQLEISKCDMMKEIIATDGRTGSAIGEALFPKLETIIIENMKNLTTMWHPILASNSLASFKMLKVKNCEKIEKILPASMSGAFANLETLKVKDCNSVQEILLLDVNADDMMPQLKYITLLQLPHLKQIWSKVAQSCLRFKNLQVVRVENCEVLEYLFPFSMALDLPQLDQIIIKQAGNMKNIVSKKEGPLDSPARFEFNQLNSLVLWNLQDLEGFCAENHTLACLSLKELDVYSCVKLKLFKTQFEKGVSNNNIQASMQQALFTPEELICNLEMLSLNNEDDRMILQWQISRDPFCKLKDLQLCHLEDSQSTFLYWILQNITSLESLVIQSNSSKVIFHDEIPRDEKGQTDIKAKLKKLTLYDLDELQHICKEGFRSNPVLEALEYLDVDDCSNLKLLVPCSVTFNCLAYLEVQNCNGLTDVITPSTARSLIMLTTLKIRECNSVEQVVIEEVGKSETGIAFNSLEVLELESLPRLKIFCTSNCLLKLPLLEKLLIRQCPRMKSFSRRETSVPLLREIVTKEQDEKWILDGDLNNTVKKMFENKGAFWIRNLDHLELSEYPELRELWYNPVHPGEFGNLKNLVVDECDFLSDVLLPLNLLQALSNLEELEVRDCDSLEAVFDLTNMNERGKSAKVIIRLKTIQLSSLPELKHIWKINSQEMVSFDNSREICFEDQDNDDVEGDIHHDQPATFHQVLLPKLETMIIEDVENLKAIWHSILSQNSLSSFQTLKVKNCGKIVNIFPSYMNGTFASLETLKVKNCKSVQEIFQLDVDDMCIVEDASQLQNVALLRLPRLKQIWSRDPQSSLCFKNLQVVRVEECEVLEYLFPFSIALDLPELEQITIKDVGNMKDIVSKKEGPLDSPAIFEFNRLNSLVLWNLQDLEGFCAENHTLACSSLKELDVNNCVKLKLFKTQYQEGVCDNNLQISIQQPLFALEELICNLEELSLNNDDDRMALQWQISRDQFCNLKFIRLCNLEDAQATFLYWILKNITSLEWLVIRSNSSKVIFQDKIPKDEKGQIVIKAKLKKLTLYDLDELQHICKKGFQSNPVLEALEYLDVDNCSNLKLLVPSSVTFNRLTYLEVQNCNGLINVITPSTARSLVMLTTLKIKECNSVQQIVVEEGEEREDEIAFCSLETLELEYLQSLKMFCSNKCSLKLPLLGKVIVQDCPRMQIFSLKDPSTETLEKVLINEEDEEGCWEGSLNRTIKKIFEDMVGFRNLECLELSEYPELGELWYNHVQMGVFGNLKNLVVHKCDFLPDVLLPLNLLQALSNLEELQVSDCDSLKAVFDLTNMNERRVSARVIIHLKTIALSSLPEVKHIWNKVEDRDDDDDESDMQHEQPATFHQVLLPELETMIIKDLENLKTIWHPIITPKSISSFWTLEVKNCEKIENIFSSYMHGAFASLETLKVEDCKSVQVIFQLGVNHMCSVEDTTQLKNVTLLRLPRLTQIWSRDPQSSLCFKNLQVVHVEKCEDLEYIFPFSIAMALPHLEEITIKHARKVKEIVSKKEGPLDSPAKFEFNQLTSLVLWHLQDLEGLCKENHTLTCSSLKHLNVHSCGKLKLFKTQHQKGVYDNNQVSMQQSLFTPEELICNLEMLSLNNEDDRMILQWQISRDPFCKLKDLRLCHLKDSQATFLYWILQHITSLESLVIQSNSSKVIFHDEIPRDEKGQTDIKAKLKKLTLYDLDELQHICKEGFQSNPVLEALEYLDVDDCSNLKLLVPCSITFNRLTYLEVQNCNGLIDVITPSTARSLIMLTTLKIRECNSVEQIVTEEAGESKTGIAFNSLEVLELESLPRLKIFCSSNCLLQLPLLEKLVIRQCPRMKSFSGRETSVPLLQEILIDIEDENWCWDGNLNTTVNKMFQYMVAFCSFKHLELSLYPELSELWYSHKVTKKVFGNLKKLVVQKCVFLSDVLLPLNLVQALSNLEVLQVSECDSLEAVFDLTNTNGKEVLEKETIQFKRITLSSLPKLKDIWKQNSQENDNFRETTKEGDIQHQEPAYCTGQVDLPSLETMTIKDMQKLKTIWDPILSPNSLGRFKCLEVNNCEKLESIFPAYMHKGFVSLETLTVSGCNSVQEIFQLGDASDLSSAVDKTQLKSITLLGLPQLKKIWSRDPQTSCAGDLQVVRVENCQILEYLFPFTIAMYLFQLEKVTIKNARKMKEIVANKERAVDHPVKFEFRRLTSLVLRNLGKLEEFFAGNHSLACPSLKELNVYNCEKLRLFKKQCISSQEGVSDNDLQVSVQQPLFTVEELICNLERLSLNNEDDRMMLQWQISRDPFCKLKFLRLCHLEEEAQATFLYWILQNIISLESLVIRSNSSKVIFQDEIPKDEKGQTDIKAQIKKLKIYNMDELQHICKEGFRSDPILEALEYLDVDDCSNLKLLVPSSVTFNRLTYLEVQNCKGLIDIITLSTTRSLVKLATLKIRKCNSVEQIVAEGGRESTNEIAFDNLKVLELESLPKLKMFCSSNCFLKLPLLVKLVIRQCPRMKSFSKKETSVPLLREIIKNEQDEKWILDGDLNSTVNKMFEDKANVEGVQGDHKESSSNNTECSSQRHVMSTSTSRALNSQEHGAQPKADEIVDSGINTHKMREITEVSLDQVSQNTLNLTKVDSAVGAEEMNETLQTPFTEAVESTKIHTLIQETATGTEEEFETIKKPFAQAARIALNSASVQDMIEESHDNQVCSSDIIFNQTTTSTIVNNKQSQEMHEIVERLFAQLVQNTPSLSTVQDADIRIREMYKIIGKAIVQVAQNLLSSSFVDNIEKSHDPKMLLAENSTTQTTNHVESERRAAIDPSSSSQAQEAVTSSFQDMAAGTKEMHETIQKPLDQTIEKKSIPNSVQDTEESQDLDIRTQEMHETFKTSSIPAAQNELSPNMVQNAATITQGMVHATQNALNSTIAENTCFGHPSGNLFNQIASSAIADKGKRTREMGETINECLIQTEQDTISPATIQNTEEPHDHSTTSPSENFFNRPTTFVTSDRKTIGSQEIDDTIDKDARSLSTAQNTVESQDSHIGAKEMHDTIKKPSSQTTQNVLNSIMIDNAGYNGSAIGNREIDDSIDKEAGSLSTSQNTDGSQESHIETQEMCNTIKKTSIPASQNVPSSTIIPDAAAIDSSPSLVESNVDINYKGMIDISEQNMPYLEAGVKRHPQVLDWLNTKRRRVLASSTFSLFAEVTRILRTTRRGYLIEDDRNDIKECCAVLEVVGFNASWLSHVYKCLEECDDGEELKRKVEETKGQACSLKAQVESIKKELASVEESLVLLLEEASKLDDFIES